MNPIPSGATFVRRDAVIANDVSDDETVMLDIDRGLYFGVKEVGRAIWKELEDPSTLDSICAELMRHYDIDEETCRREATQFVTYLVERKLVDVLPVDPPT